MLGDGLGAAEVVHAHREALRVLRAGIEAAHVDAYSDVPWPQDVVSCYERALAMARDAVAVGARSPRDDPGMGIDVDVRDDAQFEVLLALAPYTIHAEGRRQGRPVFSAGDTGTALWLAVTEWQEVELMSRLHAYGIPPTSFVAPPRSVNAGRVHGARRTEPQDKWGKGH
jgi:hypothetical protein